MTSRRGVTMVELLVYMALSGLVIMSMSTFVVNMFQARAVMATQAAVQDNARTVLSAMTVDIRQSYSVVANGSVITISSHPAAAPSTTVYTRYELQGNRLMMGSSTVPTPIPLQPMTEPDIEVTTFSVATVSSAVTIDLTLAKGNRQASLHSTVAYRQN